MAALARAVEALQQVERASEPAARFPRLELLRSAPEPNQEQLGILVELIRSQRADELAGLVHWKSQEEVLATYGRPDTIDDQGTWYYQLRGLDAPKDDFMQFHFVSDYVVRVYLF